MKRAVVFLAVGPVLVATVWLVVVTESGRVCSFELLLATMLFLFTLAGSVPIAFIDRYFARFLPIFPRGLLTAAAGSVVIWGLANGVLLAFFGGHLPPSAFPTLAFAGAAYAGVCTLLANDWAAIRPARG